MRRSPNRQAWLLNILTLCVGVLGGAVGMFAWTQADGATCSSGFSLLNPWLQCESEESLQKQEYNVFKDDLAEFVRNKITARAATEVSVYFRDLENGPWFGVNEHALFSPASMLKVPLLITFLRQAEREPQILRQQVTITEASTPAGQTIATEQRLEQGSTYTIEELLRRMIVYSDNQAMHLLGAYLDQLFPMDDLFGETLASMGIAKSEQSLNDFLTVKRYAAFYRALYNASYLSKAMSQRALDLLTQTTFDAGLRSGIPAAVTVAHKFGERADGQLHDCGIVYHPRTPYILCIMTRGQDPERLMDIISTISKMVYEEVEKRA